MLNFRLSGWSKNDSKELFDELKRHKQTLDHKAEAMFTGNVVEGKGFALRVKTALATASAKRIG